MPGYHNEGSGDRYRGRGGRGGGGWGNRDVGGSRGYSHRGEGGGRYDRYRWDEDGRQGASRGYRDNYSHDRYRDSYSSGGHSSHHYHQTQPWHDEGYGGTGRRGSEILKSLTDLGHISGRESRIALDILKTVLGSEGVGGSHRDEWEAGPPARKMRRMDWDGARSQHMHKYPHRERPYAPHQESRVRGWGGDRMGPRNPHCYRKMSNSQLREMEMARLEMPHLDKKEAKELEKKTSGVKRVREGDEEEKVSTEGAAGEEGTHSEKKEDVAEGEAEEEGKEKDEAEEGKKNEEEEPKEKEEEEGGESNEKKKEEEEEEPKEKKKEEEDTKEKKKEEEDTKENKKDVEKDERERLNLVIPRAALKCHMCNMTKFPNVKAYLSHIGSKNHERISHNFHARCASSMDLLIAEAKLGSKKTTRKTKLRTQNRWCYECDCYMNSHPKEHLQTIEHMLVSWYMEVQCCGYIYNRANVEEHRLSMRHLKNQIAVEEAQKEKEEKENKEKAVTAEEVAEFHRAVAQFKKECMEEEEEPLTSSTLPPHDHDKPIGVDMLYKETTYQCDLCHCVLTSPRHARYHFSSLEHYYSICNHLTAIEEAKELERKKQEEAEKKEKEEQEGKENAGEEEEDMTNMETVDVAEEDGDGESLADGDPDAEVEEEDENNEDEESGSKKKSTTEEDEGKGESKKKGKSAEDDEEEEDLDKEMEEDEAVEADEEEEDVDRDEDAGLEEEGEDYEEDLNGGSEEEGEGDRGL